MTEAIDRRPTWLSIGIAMAVLSVLALGFGYVGGGLLPTALALANAVVFVKATDELLESNGSISHRERAGYSVAIVVTAVGTVAPTLLLSNVWAIVVLATVLGLVYVGLTDTDIWLGSDSKSFVRVCWRSRDVFAIAAVILAVIHTGVLADGLVSLLEARAYAGSVDLLTSVVAFEVLLYLFIATVPAAQHQLESFGTLRSKRVATISVGGRRIDDLLGYLRGRIHENILLVLVQLLLLIWGWTLVQRGLALAGPMGVAFETLFLSGVLHVPLAVFVCLSVGTIVAAFCHGIVTSMWIDPPKVVAHATGGLVVALAITLPALLVPESMTNLLFDGRVETMSTRLGPGSILLGLLAVYLLWVPIALTSLIVFVEKSELATNAGLTSERTGGFLVGALLVLFASVVAAELDAPALLVFVGVAGSILTWELGHQASYLGVTMGEKSVTDDVELVHATAAVGVGGIGITLASIAGYLAGPLATGDGQAVVGIMLSLIAVVIFATLLE